MLKNNLLTSINLIAGVLLIQLASGNLNAQGLAFPEAEGFGKETTGGRDGDVNYVSNLNDWGQFIP